MIADCWALFVYANIAKIMNSKARGKCFNPNLSFDRI